MADSTHPYLTLWVVGLTCTMRKIVVGGWLVQCPLCKLVPARNVPCYVTTAWLPERGQDPLVGSKERCWSNHSSCFCYNKLFSHPIQNKVFVTMIVIHFTVHAIFLIEDVVVLTTYFVNGEGDVWWNAPLLTIKDACETETFVYSTLCIVSQIKIVVELTLFPVN